MKGFPNAKFKKFSTETEAKAYIDQQASGSTQRFFKTENVPSSVRTKVDSQLAGSSSSTALEKQKAEKQFSIEKASKRYDGCFLCKKKNREGQGS